MKSDLIRISRNESNALAVIVQYKDEPKNKFVLKFINSLDGIAKDIANCILGIEESYSEDVYKTSKHLIEWGNNLRKSAYCK